MAKTQVILGEMNLEGNRKMAFGTITQDAATTELVLTGWTTVEMMTTSPMGNGVRAAGTATHSIDEVFPVGAVVTDGVKADHVTLTLDIVSDELIGWICIGQ